jgi:hypothetical protein
MSEHKHHGIWGHFTFVYQQQQHSSNADISGLSKTSAIQCIIIIVCMVRYPIAIFVKATFL